MDELTVVSVRRQQTSGNVLGCVALEVLGGPKTFLRIWDDGDIDWGWRVHSTAVQVFPKERQ